MKKEELEKNKIDKEYKLKVPRYEQLGQVIKHAMETFLLKQKIKYSKIEFRVKSLESLIDKADRKKYHEPMSEAEDLCGVRIVTLYRTDLPNITKLIENNFTVISHSKDISSIPDNEFGYMSEHFIVRLGKKFKGPHYDDVKELKAEIQIRTILMDAWGSVSHHLSYKTAEDIPEELKKDFYALSGLFYVADTHFEMLRDKREKYIVKLKSKLFDLTQEMNMDTFAAYLNWKYPKRGKISFDLDSKELSELLLSLKNTGYMTFTKLEDKLQSVLTAFTMLEKNMSKEKEIVFGPIAVVRISMQLADDNFLEYEYKQMALPDERIEAIKKSHFQYKKYIA